MGFLFYEKDEYAHAQPKFSVSNISAVLEEFDSTEAPHSADT
jgi:hypothetical protein